MTAAPVLSVLLVLVLQLFAGADVVVFAASASAGWRLPGTSTATPPHGDR